jgi:uncharacterized phage-associated protein
MAGGREFDAKRFEELILYLARRLEPQAALGRVKLAKLLMLCDFTAYRRLGRSITGATYEKWEHGHLPHELLLSERDLEAAGALTVEPTEYYGKRLRHLAAHRDPDMSLFTEDELAVVEGVIRQYGHESASYLKWMSHQELGWRLAEEHEEIPYTTVYLSRRGPTDDDVRRGQELASVHGWN